MAAYFAVLVRERRQRLGADLISALIRAEEQGDKRRAGELIRQAIGIIIAGYETTLGLIGNGLRAVLDHPQQRALRRADPGLIQPAVEACLRYDTPILFNWRLLKAPYELAGTQLPAQAVLWLMLATGNPDPRHFDDPDAFNIQRAKAGQRAFGGGYISVWAANSPEWRRGTPLASSCNAPRGWKSARGSWRGPIRFCGCSGAYR